MTKHDQHAGAGVGTTRGSGLAYRTLRASVALSRRTSLVIIGIALALSWLLVLAGGGAGGIVPHWYYLPILFAATRFGPLAAFIVAGLAGLLAGPLTPADVGTWQAQETLQWASRAGFFVLIGQVSAWLLAPSIRLPLTEEVRRLRIEHRIRSALQQREFFLLYQPIHSIAHDRHVGVEALIRWQDPQRGLVAPDEFIGVAEETDLIHEITDFVLDEACRQAAAWKRLAEDGGCPTWHVAVNVSGRDMQRPDLARTVADTLERHRLPPELLQVELTETALALEGTRFQLYQLRKLGIRIGIDDFGTGYSSLSYLDRFPVDLLKIDRSLIANLGPDEGSQRLARAIVGLARALDMTTVAEGIETKEQLEIGRSIDFDLVQGYYFERPRAGEDVAALLMGQPQPAAAKGSGPRNV